MRTLKLDEKDALKLYPTASPEFKTLLESNFGLEFFNQKITDKIKSYEDAYELLGEDDDLPYPNPKNKKQKLETIIRALNEGWAPDWSN